MEFSFDVRVVLPGGVTVIETVDINSDIKIYSLDSSVGDKQNNSPWVYHLSANIPWDIKLKKKKEALSIIVDEIGLASAKAQNLRSPITSLKKLFTSLKQKIYILRDIENNKTVIGFLKVGSKRLFLCDDIGAHHELDPLCVLDFYIHESKQRCGLGHELFNIMLQNEKISADQLAIDRPSFKFLSFLSKHYDLKNPITQSNKYVIFPGFFSNREALQPDPLTNKKQRSRPNSYTTSEAEALSAVDISLHSNEFKKNKTYYSSAARCLFWNDEDTITNSNKQYSRNSAPFQSNNIRKSSNLNQSFPVQSCSTTHKKFEKWGSSHSTPSSLTPVNGVSRYSQRKWEEMQSSWNIFGVKPIDYSMYKNQS